MLLTLVLVAGWQIFRVFLGAVIFHLVIYFDGFYGVAGSAIGIFLLALLPRIASSRFEPRQQLFPVPAVLLLVRLALQFNPLPVLDIILSATGVVLWVWVIQLALLPGVFDFKRNERPLLATAFIAAAVVDAGIRLTLFSYDLVYRHSVGAGIAAVSGVGLALWLLYREYRDETRRTTDCLNGYGWLLLFLGPWMYLGFTHYFNPAALTAVSGLGDTAAELVTLIVIATGAIAGVCLASGRIPYTPAVCGLGAALLVLASHMLVRQYPAAGLLWFISGGISLWFVPGAILGSRREGAADDRSMLLSTGLAMFGALLLMVILIFTGASFRVHEASTAAALLLLAPAMVFSLRGRQGKEHGLGAGLVMTAGCGAAMILLLVLRLLLHPAPEAVTVNNGRENLRVMTWNIHQGYSADYRVDLEAMARLIEAEQPDIIALQEVNRGHIQNGLIDCLGYLSHRLGMPYVFGANYEDGLYGNAFLSRLPLVSWRNHVFEHNNSDSDRGVLHAVYRTPLGEFNVLVTHLDHVIDNTIRIEQAREVLAVYGNRKPALVMGDLNATPDAPEIALFDMAGLRDVLLTSGHGKSRTFLGEKTNEPDMAS